MSILALLGYWYLFSKFYILGSIFVTHILNVSFKKLWLSPLLVNAVSIGLLMIGIATNFIKKDMIFDAIYRIYLPVVFSSFMMNIGIGLFRKLRRKK